MTINFCLESSLWQSKVAKDLEIDKSKSQSGQSELLTKDNPIESEVTVSKDPISENCKTNYNI